MPTIAILADIHGCLPALEKALEQLAAFKPEHYLLLGDLLNHGPRNPVPEGYAPAEVAERLNLLKGQIIAVRGNCDSEVDQMLLEFPALSPCNYLLMAGFRVCMSHGHLFAPEQLALSAGDLLLTGHTHKAGITRSDEGILIFNPGSITFPRGEWGPSFGLYQSGSLTIRALDDAAILASHVLVA